jgi:asparagine synthase (glutamine-hydrolysing)
VPYFGAAIRVAGQTLLGRTRINSKAFSLLEHGGTYTGAYLLRRGVYMPSDLGTILDHEVVKEGLRRLRPMELIGSMLQPAPQTDFGIVATLESSLYMRNQLLRDSDWASMAHSLEVRVPLVDATLLQQISRITVRAGTGNQKSLLANAPSRSELLRASLARPKTGFSTPIARWLERENAVKTWESIPDLAKSGCAWAKRWAFAVGGPNKNT